MVCKLWDAESGKLLRELRGHEEKTPHHFRSMLFVCAFSPDGKHLATGDKVGHIVVWEVATGKQLAAVEAPDTTWGSPLAVFEAAQTHEATVSKRIFELVDVAMGERDHASGAFLQWFVNEQVEEEAQVADVVARLRLVGSEGRGILLVDQELMQRPAPTPPPA